MTWKTYPVVVSKCQYAQMEVRARTYAEAWRKAEKKAEEGDWDSANEWGFEVDAKNFDFSDVLIIGYQDGELVVRSSNMTRAEAVFMLLAAVDHARGSLE